LNVAYCVLIGSWRLLSPGSSGVLQPGLLPHSDVGHWSVECLANWTAEDHWQVDATRLLVVRSLHGQWLQLWL